MAQARTGKLRHVSGNIAIAMTLDEESVLEYHANGQYFLINGVKQTIPSGKTISLTSKGASVTYNVLKFGPNIVIKSSSGAIINMNGWSVYKQGNYIDISFEAPATLDINYGYCVSSTMGVPKESYFAKPMKRVALIKSSSVNAELKEATSKEKEQARKACAKAGISEKDHPNDFKSCYVDALINPDNASSFAKSMLKLQKMEKVSSKEVAKEAISQMDKKDLVKIVSKAAVQEAKKQDVTPASEKKVASALNTLSTNKLLSTLDKIIDNKAIVKIEPPKANSSPTTKPNSFTVRSVSVKPVPTPTVKPSNPVKSPTVVPDVKPSPVLTKPVPVKPTTKPVSVATFTSSPKPVEVKQVSTPKPTVKPISKPVEVKPVVITKPSESVSVKPTIKPATPKPTVKPTNNGVKPVIPDIKTPKSVSKPTELTSIKPDSTPTKPVSVKPTKPTVGKPPASTPKPVSSVSIVKPRGTVKPVVKPTVKPISKPVEVKPVVVTKLSELVSVKPTVNPVATPTVPKPTVKPTSKPSDLLSVRHSATPKPVKPVIVTRPNSSSVPTPKPTAHKPTQLLNSERPTVVEKPGTKPTMKPTKPVSIKPTVKPTDGVSANPADFTLVTKPTKSYGFVKPTSTKPTTAPTNPVSTKPVKPTTKPDSTPTSVKPISKPKPVEVKPVSTPKPVSSVSSANPIKQTDVKPRGTVKPVVVKPTVKPISKAC
ncbi:predicted protein [Naegleria gruberi]|uniref:Predicted protein n=1 Tax=Naegleria gruberi TaxID=5762 RepID=D2VEU5_NAEGR|nr:uncharacterized protein NAEGRDRAFT_48959 [Naegleria gruberi]EFC44664.1 predicted protein [Naegleria gruberi]|eukprot:XP_002677408.1 predicted protein [Naegleria gruberi strain NEG-M]